MKAMHFFFYGTLVAGHTNPVARLIHAKLRPAGPATVSGKLYAIPKSEGWYPALLPGDGDVHGMLYAVHNGFGEADLARMDDYEDFHPGHAAISLYIRESRAICREDGTSHQAQTYRYSQPLPPDAQFIPNGNFSAWLDEHGLIAFASARH